MSWRLVARQGVREGWRNWELRGTVVGFSLIFGLIGYWTGPAALGGDGNLADFFGFLSAVVIVLVPATAVALAHDDVAGRREDGRLRLLLGQPLSRRSIVVGQYVAAGATVVAAVLVSVTTGLFVATLRAGTLAPPKIAFGLIALGVLLAVAYVGIGIAISTWLETTNFTGTLAFGAFLVFTFVWPAVPRTAIWVVNKFASMSGDPWWLSYVDTISPVVATGQLVAPVVSLSELDSASQPGVYAFSVVVLGLWIVGLPALALRSFERSDL